MTITHELGSFAIVPLWVIEALAERKSKALALYAGLAKWTSGEDRTCYPSRQTVADYLGVSRDTVDRWAADLQEIGALTVEHRYSEDGDLSSNLYTVRVVRQGGRTDAVTPSRMDAATGGRMDAAGTKPKSEPNPNEHSESVQFDRFWEQYPRKQGKAEARKRWEKMGILERTDALDVMTDWCRFYSTVNPKFIPYASTWLNQQRWEDNIPDTPTADDPPAPRSKVGCDDCDHTGWVEVEDPTLRAGVGMAKCDCQQLSLDNRL